ncbi:MAG: tetratricopeptide repeat protein [Acidobacteriota bacterium]
MSKSAAEGPPGAPGRPLGLVGLGLLLALALTPTLSAQDEVRRIGAIEMPLAAQQNLVLLREHWARWEGAVAGDQRDLAGASVDELLATAELLGFEALADLSRAAVSRAVEVAVDGDLVKARWALEDAERLDPGAPEVAFGEAAVHRHDGSWWPALQASSRGYLRLLSQRLERRVMLHGALFFVLFALLCAGFLFLALQMATKGGSLFADVVKPLGRVLPAALAYPLAALALLWPLALPQGLLWLAIFWSVLLWGYGSGSERTVLIGLWLLLGVTPLLLAEQRARLEVALAPPARALDSLIEGRLYGEIFSDLGSLPALFPEEAAVQHLMADVHRKLDYWPVARNLYEQMAEEDAGAVDAQINLGVYYFQQNKFPDAVNHFKKATELAPDNVLAHFNLSKAYAESYYFSEQSAAFQRAQELDRGLVGQWIRETEKEQVRTSEAGLDRLPEIRRRLLALQRGDDSLTGRLSAARRWFGPAVAGLLLLAALALHLLRRPFGYANPALSDVGGGRIDRAVRFLVPGFFSAEVGYGARAYLTLLIPVVLVLLPLARHFSFVVPVGVDPGPELMWALCLGGLALFYGLRLVVELRNPA